MVVCNYNGAAASIHSGLYRSDQLPCLNVIYSFETELLRRLSLNVIFLGLLIAPLITREKLDAAILLGQIPSIKRKMKHTPTVRKARRFTDALLNASYERTYKWAGRRKDASHGALLRHRIQNHVVCARGMEFHELQFGENEFFHTRRTMLPNMELPN